MRPLYGPLLIGASAALLVGAIATAANRGQAGASPIYGVRLPGKYRQWQVVSVAHEAGSLNDIRVILGNRTAMQAFRSGKRPFPDGSMIARIAWKLESSERNNAIFGRSQSFVAGETTNVQIKVKDAKRFRASGGWGYG